MNSIWYLNKYTISPLLAAMTGGYLFAWGAVTLGISMLVYSGADYHSAETGMFILAFPLMLAAFLWSFIANRLSVWLLLFVGGACMTLAAWVLQNQMVNQ